MIVLIGLIYIVLRDLTDSGVTFSAMQPLTGLSAHLADKILTNKHYMICFKVRLGARTK